MFSGFTINYFNQVSSLDVIFFTQIQYFLSSDFFSSGHTAPFNYFLIFRNSYSHWLQFWSLKSHKFLPTRNLNKPLCTRMKSKLKINSTWETFCCFSLHDFRKLRTRSKCCESDAERREEKRNWNVNVIAFSVCCFMLFDKNTCRHFMHLVFVRAESLFEIACKLCKVMLD